MVDFVIKYMCIYDKLSSSWNLNNDTFWTIIIKCTPDFRGAKPHIEDKTTQDLHISI